MKEYLIESVKCGVGEGGFACGPVDGPVVGEAEIKDSDGNHFFVSLAEVMGLENFYKTDESAYEALINPEMDDETIDFFDKHYIAGGEYADVLEDTEAEYYDIFRYLIYVVRSDWDECKEFMEATSGKYLHEIIIP